MEDISGQYQGKLSNKDAECSTAPLNTRDIVLSLESEPDYIAYLLTISSGFLGFRVRAGARANIKTLKVEGVQNDLVQLWNGGVSIEHFEANHCLPVKYCKENHPDVFQAFAKMGRPPFHMEKVFSDLYIGSADVVIHCHDLPDGEDKKNGFLFTELCEYRNISLFSKGVTFKSNSSAPYFLDMTSGQGVVIGSEEHPIDPDKVSNKAIRIGGQSGTKKNPPACSNITIHAYEGLEVVLGESAKNATNIIRYKKAERKSDSDIEQKPKVPKMPKMSDNHRRMSDEGVKELIKSEDAIDVVYLDEAGYPTLGVGHLLHPSELMSGKITLYSGQIIDFREPITQEEIIALLKHDLRSRCLCVDESVGVELNQGQFDALVHFIFNIGNSAFRSSTLLRQLNEGDYDSVPDQFRVWNKITVTVGGQRVKRVSQGLVNRREKVVKMWQRATSDDFSIDGYIAYKDIPEEVVPIEHDYPIATDREMRGIDKQVKSIWWSRIFNGGILGLLGLGSTGGALSKVEDVVSELSEKAINDPVGVAGEFSDGFEKATVNVGAILQTSDDLYFWVACAATGVALVFIGLAVVLYARLDDRAKGIN